MLEKLTVENFIEELASSSPAPGGGGAAALGTALAAALNSMVYNLTKDKKVYKELTEEKRKELLENLEASVELYKKAIEFMNKDREAFLGLIASYKLSKDTEEDRKIREKTIKEATENCINVPLTLAEISLKFYENIEFAMKYGNKNLISDAGVAAIMLNSAIESSVLNVAINLSSIDNEENKKFMKEKINNILKESSKYKEIILKGVYNYIKNRK
jgi:formiminotetrahydrofolate cyclodeaminase